MVEDEARTIAALLNQEDDGIERDDFGNVKVGTMWNILSGRWYRQWRRSHGLPTSKGDGETQESLGPIDNSDILLPREEYYCGDGSSTDLDTIMKPKVVLDDDYLILPPKAWSLLVHNYGLLPNSEIHRKSIPLPKTKETQVEVTLRKLLLSVYLPTEQKLLDPKPIYFSRKHTLADVKARILLILRPVIPTDCLKADNFRLWRLEPFLKFETDIKKPFIEREQGQILTFPGKLMSEDTKSLDEADLMFETMLVAEFKESEGNWLYRSPEIAVKPKCSYCQHGIEKNPIVCYCKKVRFM